MENQVTSQFREAAAVTAIILRKVENRVELLVESNDFWWLVFSQPDDEEFQLRSEADERWQWLVVRADQ
jgi:hypothetical protein